MTNNTTLSRQEMIEAIYEKIADKTLGFGCKIIYNHDTNLQDNQEGVICSYGEGRTLVTTLYYNESVWKDDIQKIIGHPVMIGDVMDFIERNFPDGIHCIKCKKGKILSDNFNDDTIFYCDNEDCEFLSKFYGDEAFCHKMELYDSYWQEKRKPIEEQSDDCIDFVYNLISK